MYFYPISVCVLLKTVREKKKSYPHFSLYTQNMGKADRLLPPMACNAESCHRLTKKVDNAL